MDIQASAGTCKLVSAVHGRTPAAAPSHADEQLGYKHAAKRQAWMERNADAQMSPILHLPKMPVQSGCTANEQRCVVLRLAARPANLLAAASASAFAPAVVATCLQTAPLAHVLLLLLLPSRAERCHVFRERSQHGARQRRLLQLRFALNDGLATTDAASAGSLRQVTRAHARHAHPTAAALHGSPARGGPSCASSKCMPTAKRAVPQPPFRSVVDAVAVAATVEPAVAAAARPRHGLGTASAVVQCGLSRSLK
eukprot:353839-Chlamydomonas_euryale.AAC.9